MNKKFLAVAIAVCLFSNAMNVFMVPSVKSFGATKDVQNLTIGALSPEEETTLKGMLTDLSKNKKLLGELKKNLAKGSKKISSKSILKLTAAVKDSNPQIAYVYVADKKGNMYIDLELPQGYDPRERSWYKEASTKKDFYVSEVYSDALTSDQLITVGLSIRDTKGKLLGVVAIDYILKAK